MEGEQRMGSLGKTEEERSDRKGRTEVMNGIQRRKKQRG